MRAIFTKSLSEVTDILNKTQGVNKALEKGSKIATNGMQKSFEKMRVVMDRILKSIKSVFNVMKNMALTSMISLGGLGFRGIQAQKQTAESRVLGITNQQRGALQFAGRASGFGEDFFKDILGSIKNSLVTEEGAGAFGALGMNVNEARGLSSMELLNKVLENAKKSKLPMQVLSKFITEITGLDWNTFQALDLGKFKKDFREGLSLSSNSADQLKGMGESLNRVITSFGTFIDKMLVPLTPLVENIFDNISESFKKLGESEVFNNALKDIANWVADVTKDLDKTFEQTIKDLPTIFANMKIVFFDVISGLSWLLSYLPGIGDKATKRLEDISASFKGKSERAEIELERDKALEGLRDYFKGKNVSREALEKGKEVFLSEIKDKLAKTENFDLAESRRIMKESADLYDKKLTLEINVNGSDGEIQRLAKTINMQQGSIK